MEEQTRKTGIDFIGTVPWGTHLCQFYDTKQDLIGILVPYFKAGLQNNEFCIWVTSEPLGEKEAEEAMRKAVPNFAQYLERGQIEVVPHTDWYLKDGTFNAQRVLNAWIDKLNQALANGYDGMRVTGNTAWLEKEGWRNFLSYEEEINNAIGKYRMLAICTYSLGKCGTSEVLDVVDKHQFALFRQIGDWLLSKPMQKLRMPAQGASPTGAGKRLLPPLQERFIQLGLEGLSDQELIELLLSQHHPRPECRKLVKECIRLFGNLRGLLTASPQELEEAGICTKCIFSLKLLRELPIEILKQKLIEQPVYHSSKEVFDYLSYSMRDLKNEVFKVIYLNSRHQIIDTADLFEGTLDSIPIRPREIVESAIKHSASALIFAHNHPTGDPTPSKSDKQLTRDLVFIGMILQIKILDHIIIGENRYFSFADEGLIQKYEDNFLNLKIRGVFDNGVEYLKNLPLVFAPLVLSNLPSLEQTVAELI